MRNVFVIYFFISFTISHGLFAQDQQNKRPKVGLVLSGGGAKGLAHIGVIRSMEKAGIVPDYIAGTSMGSLVGALYAIGYTADEMEAFVDTLNWDVLLGNSIDFTDIAFEEKDYYGRYFAEFPYDDGKLSLPRGVIDGQKLSMLFSRITRSVHHIEDFHQLPIPFECMGADIATGMPVVLDHGSLAVAMRASMAIPTIFTPVEIEDHLLVDGGLLRNFPVQNVIEMGADFIIGINVADDLTPKEELKSLLDLLGQSAFIMSAFDTREQKKNCDILIEPDLKGYSTGSFRSGDSIISRGDKAGKLFFEAFKKLTDSLNRYGDPREVVKLPNRNNYKISEIKIEGSEKISKQVILEKFKFSKTDSLSIDRLEDRISLLYGGRYFDKITYEIIENNEGDELRLSVTEAPAGKVKIAAHYDSENKAGINTNITFRNVLGNYSRILLEIDFAENPLLDVNYLKYFTRRKVAAIITGVKLTRNLFPVYDDNRESSVFKTGTQRFFATVQSTFSQKMSFGVTAEFHNSVFKPLIFDEIKELVKVENSSTSGLLFFGYNTYNRPFYPTKGIILNINYLHDFNGTNKIDLKDANTGDIVTTSENADDFQAANLDFSYIIQVSSKVSIITRNTIWVSTLPANSLNLDDYFFVGGFNPQFLFAIEYWGAGQYEFPANNYFYSKLGLQWEMFPKIFLTGIANYSDSEYPMKWISSDIETIPLGNKDRRFGYGASLGYNSLFGPVIVSVAKDVFNDDYKTNLSIGFWF